MVRWRGAVAAVWLSACGSLLQKDAGPACESWGPPPPPVGCECGFASVTRCGFTETANCGTCGVGLTCAANACQPPPWDGDSSGSLSGSEAFDASVRGEVTRPDGGLATSVRVSWFDRAPASVCGAPAAPFSSVELRVELPDGGFIGAGAYPLGDAGVVIRTGPSGSSARSTSGTVRIDRLEARSIAGRFDATLALEDGGTSTLQGTWSTGVCP